MQKTRDYEHRYADHDDNSGVCRVRVYEEGLRRPVVVATDLPKNEGVAANAAEFIAADLIREGILSEAHVSHDIRTEAVQKGILDPISKVAPFVFVEERTDSERSFNFLWFHSYEIIGLIINGRTRECIGQPEWQPTSREEVEALIGASLNVGLRLSSYSLAQDESLTFRISDHPSLAEATVLGLRLLGVEEAETAFRLATGMPATMKDEELEATLNDTNAGGLLRAGSVYEVKALEPSDQHGILATLIGGLDFPRTCFRVKADASEPSLTAEEAVQAAGEIERRREEMYAEPLGDPTRPNAEEFRVLMFVERLLLTRYLRVPGVELIPLLEPSASIRTSVGIGASDEVGIINAVLRDMNWMRPQDSVDASWGERNSRERPVILVQARRVFATTHEQAMRLAHNRRDRLLELLAFHRNFSGVPFATAIQKLDGTTGQYADMRVYPEVETYRGNLLGGFISGEDQSVLMAHDRAMRSEPFLGFVLYLHMEAQAEKDLDFAYFRYWNLLETIAAERVRRDTPVTDFNGQQILKADGKPFDTDGARGRVYVLLKRGMQAHGYTEQTFSVAQELSVSLWHALYVWYAFRNATAHHGGFNPDDPNQQKQSWYRAAVEAQNAGAQPSGVQPDPYFSYLKHMVTDVVRWELESAGGI